VTDVDGTRGDGRGRERGVTDVDGNVIVDLNVIAHVIVIALVNVNAPVGVIDAVNEVQ
jgi:hypothetical protein